MWALKAAWGYVQGSTPAKIEGGSVYELNGSTRTLLFREADCEWVRIPGQQFDSKVVLTRVVASLAEIKPNELEIIELNLKQLARYDYAHSSGEHCFTFERGDGSTFLYTSLTASPEAAGFVDASILRGLFETHNQASAEKELPMTLEVYRNRRLAHSSAPTPSRSAAAAPSSSPATPSRGSALSKAVSIQRPLPSSATLVSSSPACKLLLLDATGSGDYRFDSTVFASVYRNGNDHYLIVRNSGNDGLVFSGLLNADLNISILPGDKGLSWNVEDGLTVTAWRIEADSAGSLGPFLAAVRRGVLPPDTKDDDVEYLMSNALRYADASDDESYAEQDFFDDDDDEDDMRGRSTRAHQPGSRSDGPKNSLLTLAHSHNRALVFRGDKMGVFVQGNDGDLEFSTAIDRIKMSDGRTPLTPNKAMMYDRDRSLVFTDKAGSDTLFRMDLERGTVVDEWTLDEGMKAMSIAPTEKMGGMRGDPTFIGVTNSAVFQVDPRLQTKKGTSVVNHDLMKLYSVSSKTGFNSAATTASGHVVLGSTTGDLRLYDNISKVAKSHLPGFGDPIVGVDTTADGRYVLATYKTYILLVDTTLKNDTSGKNGFQKGLKSSAPVPYRLQLRAEDVARLGCPVSFTTAHFDVGDEQEKLVVTSCGPHVIVWNLRRIENGKLDYRIGTYEDAVVADQFFNNQRSRMVVALRDDVLVAQTQQLASPTKSMR